MILMHDLSEGYLIDMYSFELSFILQYQYNLHINFDHSQTQYLKEYHTTYS